ncbi:hypothetical protein IL306_013349 [Fusarium sp. DS 682]|nr:hypothetical protein IL306_013349 [Fusarium sp. DS 682]
MSWDSHGREDNVEQVSIHVDEYGWVPHAPTPRNENLPSHAYPYGERPLRRAVLHRPDHHFQEIERLAVENSDLKRDLREAQATISRLQAENDDVTERHEKHKIRLREVQDAKENLQKEVTELRGKLSYATENLTKTIRKEINAAKNETSSVESLKKTISGQTRSIQNLKKEKEAAVKQLNQLRSQTPQSKAAKKRNKNSGNQESPSDDSVVTTTQAPDPDPRQTPAPAPALPTASTSTSTDFAETIISGRLVHDSHVTAEVLAQFREVLKSPTPDANNLYGFLYHGKFGAYLCFHEVCEKGPGASNELRAGSSGCQVGGDKCKFLVKVVSVDSIKKFLVYNPAVDVASSSS